MLLITLGLAACKDNKKALDEGADTAATTNNNSSSFVLKHLKVNRNRIMQHITCTEQTVDSLLAIDDTIYSRTDTYQLDYLHMGDEYINTDIQQLYNDTIPIAIAILDTHTKLTQSGADKADASFIWHEAAKTLMKEFYKTSEGIWTEPDS